MFARVTLAAVITMAPVTHTRVVSANPADTTPHVLDGIVNTIALVGGTVVVGGSFSEVADARRTTTFPRSNLFAFDLATGDVLADFAPVVAGPVHALAAGADGTVYVGGDFPSVNRTRARALTRLSLSDGSTVRGFAPRVSGGAVTTLARRGAHLYTGGDFTSPRTALARLDATTGAADPRFTIEPGLPRTPKVKVHALAASADRLVIDGSFTTLDGEPRPQLGVIDISTPTPRVANWRTAAYEPQCQDVFPSYVRGLDLSPGGDYFVVVTTGGNGDTRRLCDSAARFETYTRSQRVRPTWVNYTGGDSLYSVAATGAAVYVGGHQRWMDNPRGRDSAGPGAAPREGIAALDPRTGKALGWNPGRERGIGVKAFLAYNRGLLVGSDTTRLGREYHARIGMFPLP
ncbi:hypothetical protein [Nonomuraea endophytica]|uniref:PKD domain containing protein n=1 Tax=Nonomuraea endophytica TaxID=714136 RepID=A0A7W7ZXY4_9ACTN|nr:hypothetical protein [Nonomuraea endophytica]MBB5075514.1 hypothetical protein [Nonomuraea endophytica]